MEVKELIGLLDGYCSVRSSVEINVGKFCQLASASG